MMFLEKILKRPETTYSPCLHLKRMMQNHPKESLSFLSTKGLSQHVHHVIFRSNIGYTPFIGCGPFANKMISNGVGFFLQDGVGDR